MFTTTGFLLSLEWGNSEDTDTSASWSPGQALKNLGAAPGIIWAPKYCAPRSGCCGTYVAVETQSQLRGKGSTSGPPLPTVEKDMREWNKPSHPTRCLMDDRAPADNSRAKGFATAPNPTSLGECGAWGGGGGGMQNALQGQKLAPAPLCISHVYATWVVG
jgi:hypothetical protein